MRQRVLSSHSHNTVSVATLDSNLVEQVYARCASVYDWLCGPILQAGRREAMYELRRQPGNQILEIGIGTGLTVPLYPDDYAITGIDVSEPMLREAARNIDGRNNIQLFRMDAARLTFPDESHGTTEPRLEGALRRACGRQGLALGSDRHQRSRTPPIDMFGGRTTRFARSRKVRHASRRSDHREPPAIRSAEASAMEPCREPVSARACSQRLCVIRSIRRLCRLQEIAEKAEVMQRRLCVLGSGTRGPVVAPFSSGGDVWPAFGQR